jgi:hypothetical protein
MLNFKKLSNDCYYITDGKNAINMTCRKSIGIYCIDIAQYYFEETTLTKVKAKIEKYWLDGKFELFEI